jgi:hypothetical protein
MAIAGKGGRPLGQPKTGGRTKGTPNRVTLTIKEKLDGIGCDPLIELAEIAMDSKYRIEIRVRCLSEIASYLYPKRRPVDISSDESPVTNVITMLDPSPGGSDVGNQPDSKP